MRKLKWNWIIWGLALLVTVGLSIPSFAEGEDAEKKSSWKDAFKKKSEEAEETVEAAEAEVDEAVEVIEEVEEALDEPLTLPPIEAPVLPEEEKTGDWAFGEEPDISRSAPVSATILPPPGGQKAVRLHKVGPGENLHILAAYYYGDARAWTRIYQLNRKKISNPNLIREGMMLEVEVPPGWKPRFNLEEFLLKEKTRVSALEQARMEKPIIIRETQTVVPTIAPLEELEEETGAPVEVPEEVTEE